MKASDSINSIERYSDHKDLNTVRVCVTDLKNQLEIIRPLLEEVEQIRQAIKKGHQICKDNQ